MRGIFQKEHMVSLFSQLDELYRKFPWDVLGQQAIFLNILNHISDKKPGSIIKRNGFVYDILDDLHRNFNKPLSMQNLACKYNYSKDYISRKLKQETGYTPFEYVQSIRLQTAKEFLSNTDYSVDIISRQVGYSDVSLLYKAFKATTGKTPGQWRKKSRSN
ncbi:MAG: AraC family transcriptional regulator [Dethiobacteria bacterium]|nr:AraC family transcriptional regulator [Dethiobacteria bacterium]